MVKKGIDFMKIPYNGIGLGVQLSWDNEHSWLIIVIPFVQLQVRYCWKEF